MADQFSIESFTSNIGIVYLSASYNTVAITFTAKVHDNRWDLNNETPQSTYLTQIDNAYTWSEAYSYSTYNLAKNTAEQQNVVINSDNLGNINYSIPGTTYASGGDTFYTWTKYYDINNFQVGSTSDKLTLVVSDENSNSLSSFIEIQIIKVATGIKLGGSLNVTKSNLHDVTDLLNESVKFEVANADRIKSTDSLAFNYYIQTEYNLNNLITYTASSSTDNLDDAYMFNGVTIQSSNAVNPILNFPAIDSVLIDAGLIDALDPDTNNIGNFAVKLLLSINNQGDLSGSISISGDDVIPNVIDSNLLAQLAYWPINSFNLPDVNSEYADNFIPLKASNLSTHFSNELNTILNYYQGKKLIESWTITLDSIESSSNNVLAKYARDVLNSGNSSVFSEGAKVVADGAFNYNISINDYQNKNVVIISDTNIYGVIVQKS